MILTWPMAMCHMHSYPTRSNVGTTTPPVQLSSTMGAATSAVSGAEPGLTWRTGPQELVAAAIAAGGVHSPSGDWFARVPLL